MKQSQRIPITNPPIYLMNNLTSTSQFVAFLTYTSDKIKVNLLNRKTKEVNQIQIQDTSIPTSIQYLPNNALVVTTSTGYYIYSENGQEQYHKLRNQLEDHLQYFIGAAYVNPESSKPFYAIGYENKIIFVDSVQTKTEIFGVQLKDIRPTCITCIFQYLIYGDDKGFIYTNKCVSFSQVTEYKQLDLKTKNTSIMSVKAMEIKATSQIIAVAADFIGRITIVDLKEWTISSVINAHIKPITGLAINQKQEHIISASDDTFVNIWKLNNKEQPQLIVSQHLEDSVITGVTSDIYVAAYDQYELIFLEQN